MQSIGLENGEAIEHRMVNNAIEKAQRKVEGHNFDIRKNLLEFDDVSNDQRQVIYQQRRDLMATSDISETIEGIPGRSALRGLISEYMPAAEHRGAVGHRRPGAGAGDGVRFSAAAQDAGSMKTIP